MHPQTLARPPIIFASLEAKFNPSKSVEIARIETYAQSLSSDYPNLQNIETRQISFGTTEEDDSFQNVKSRRSGFQVTTKSSNRSIRAEVGAYAVAFHGGYYPPWPALKDFFLSNLQPYLEASRQNEISRIGLRIVNRLMLPVEEEPNLSEFIKTDIVLPQSIGFPNSIASFNTDVIVPFDSEYSCRVKQQTEPVQRDPKTADVTLGFVLDTDASRTKTFSVDDSEELEPTFERLREIKNLAFFGSFTDRALEKYV